MVKRRFTAPAQNRKIGIYNVDEESTGSEELILESGNKDRNRIMRTTEVVVDNVEKGTC